MTSRGTNILVQDPLANIMGVNITMGLIMDTLIEAEGMKVTDLEKDLEIGRIAYLELGPPVDREGIILGRNKIGHLLTLDFTMKKRLETHPEGRTDMRKDIVTLAMMGIAEDTARRP